MVKKNKETISIIANVTKSLTKKGKLKDKKLKLSCCHMVYSKKGKLKSKIVNNNDGTCTCELCKQSFAGKLYEKDEVKEIISPVMDLLQGTKYTAAAAGVNNEGLNYVVGTMMAVKKLPKFYSKIRKVVAKSEEKKKGSKISSQSLDSSSFGSWGER